MTLGRAQTLAQILATAVGGVAEAVPTPDDNPTFVVVLADGRVPVLLREYSHAVSVSVEGEGNWTLRPPQVDAVVPQLTSTIQTWARSRPPGHASLFAIAVTTAKLLGQALREPWVVGFSGAPEPREAWLHGPSIDAAVVGVFPRQVRVAVDGVGRSVAITDLRTLATLDPGLLAAVQAQRASYRRNLAHSQEIQTLAAALAERLSARLGAPITVEIQSRTSHAAASVARLMRDRTEVGRVFAEADRVRVHAGLEGRSGWTGAAAEVDDGLSAIVAAIERADQTLTLERLEVGRRYRVRERIQQLEPGMVLRFVGFDDVDNHYGRYVFADDDGHERAVSGDFSRPRFSPLGKTDRYLEPAD